MITQELIEQVKSLGDGVYAEAAALQKQVDELLLKKGKLWNDAQCK